MIHLSRHVDLSELLLYHWSVEFLATKPLIWMLKDRPLNFRPICLELCYFFTKKHGSSQKKSFLDRDPLFLKIIFLPELEKIGFRVARTKESVVLAPKLPGNAWFSGGSPKVEGWKTLNFWYKILVLIKFFCSDDSKTCFFEFLAKNCI